MHCLSRLFGRQKHRFQLRNNFNFCSVLGIMNTSGHLHLVSETFLASLLTLQEIGYIHDSMNRPKMNLLLIFTFYIISHIYIFNFHLPWPVFWIFLIKLNTREVSE